MLVDGFNHRLQGERVPPRQFLQFLVEGMMKQIVVNVPHQMEMALLLVAGNRIIRSVEVRDQDTSEVSKGLFKKGSFPSRMIEVNDDIGIRKRPDVTDRPTPNIDLRLIGMDEHPQPQQLQHLISSLLMDFCQTLLGFCSELVGKGVTEDIIDATSDVVEGLPECDVLVDRPACQGVPGLLIRWVSV